MGIRNGIPGAEKVGIMWWFRIGRRSARGLAGKRIRLYGWVVLAALIVGVMAGVHDYNHPSEVPSPAGCTLCHDLVTP